MTLKRAQIVQMRGALRLRRIGDERDGVTVGVDELVTSSWSSRVAGAALIAAPSPASAVRRRVAQPAHAVARSLPGRDQVGLH